MDIPYAFLLIVEKGEVEGTVTPTHASSTRQGESRWWWRTVQTQRATFWLRHFMVWRKLQKAQYINAASWISQSLRHAGRVMLSVLLLQHIVCCQGLFAPTWETKKKCFTSLLRHSALSKKKKVSLQTCMLSFVQLCEILCIVKSAWEGRLYKMNMWAEATNPSNQQFIKEVNCKKIWCTLSKVLHPLQFAVATAVKVLLFFSVVIPCCFLLTRETFSSAWILCLFESL